MYTLYRLNADELDEGFLQSLKALFKGQIIEIAVSGADDASEDETTYLLRDPTNRMRLLQALENARRGDLVSVDLNDAQS
ncbi:MAG: hypothetical protein MUC77_18965 [Chromatiaceae bacterium]|jgi:antitoxin YefM|nr:hypothetical protein [Chromatiaceae bacterium]